MGGPIDPGALSAAIAAMLRAANTPTDRLDVFEGEPTAVMDSDGRAHPYAAVYVSPGAPDPWSPDRSVCDLAGVRSARVQVTAAGGDLTRAHRAIARVLARLDEQNLMIAGREFGRAQQDGDPGPVLVDRDVQPWRWYLPIGFTVIAGE